jgi:hypothetical protein
MNQISNSAKFTLKYNEILQKVKKRWKGNLSKDIDISESKSSRILNNKQFDVLVLIEMASICGYDCEFEFKERYVEKI